MCPSPCVWNEEDYKQPLLQHRGLAQAVRPGLRLGQLRDNEQFRVPLAGGRQRERRDGCGSCYNATRYGADAPCDAFFTKPHACCPTRYHWTVVVEAPDESNDMPDYGEEGMDGALPRPKRSPASSTRTRPLMERMTSLGKITRQG